MKRATPVADLVSKFNSIQGVTAREHDNSPRGIVVGPPQSRTETRAIEIEFDEAAAADAKQRVKEQTRNANWTVNDDEPEYLYIEGAFPNEEYYEYYDRPVADWYGD